MSVRKRCANKIHLVSPDAERVTYNKLGFIKKFLELNKVMWDTNSGLTSSHPYDSRPEVIKFTCFPIVVMY